MFSRFSVDEAQLVSLFVDSVFYGFYLITFFSCFHGLLTTNDGRLKSRSAINYTMVAASLWMLVFSTLQVSCHLRFVLDAFVYSDNKPVDTLSDMPNPVNVMLLVTYVAQTFMGDCILLYRCWVIYDRRWMIVICPILMCIAETGCGIAAVYLETTLGDGSSITDPRLFPLIITLQSLTLTTNVITTFLIVHRIWTIHSAIRRLVPSTKNHPLKNSLVVLIESASVYTASVAVLLIVYVLRSNADYVISDLIVQVIGITFNLIIIRFARGTAVKPIEETLTSLRIAPRRMAEEVTFENSAWSRSRPSNDTDTQTTYDIEGDC
ncbi:hypothetical protein IW261DRAFT_1495008 [Armillaria novae-zelandiae]|uniref:Uncharacterized protein n=1 Tax=Armillaria novae-zelandiae TaxID=153914 RepID=A0AA39P1E0_9AGAR|nr:hypothetical protein IW261DRAFT_1495008 [Armillaria novae-zelandiae]